MKHTSYMMSDRCFTELFWDNQMHKHAYRLTYIPRTK